MIDYQSLRILAVAQERGPVADLVLFKQSNQSHTHYLNDSAPIAFRWFVP